MVVSLITPRKKKFTVYTDFKMDLEKSPVSSDLTLNKNEEAVKQSIKNLILTDRGERLMQPNLGGNIKAMLFETITPATLKLIEEQVRSTINLHEPRADLIDVLVSSEIDDNTVVVKIAFYISNNQQPISLSVILERTR
jgi:phage baseplate assembly protein W